MVLMNFIKFTAKRISNLKQYRAETPIYVHKVHESEIKDFSLCNYFPLMSLCEQFCLIGVN